MEENELLTEWAEKIYKTTDEVWKKLVELHSLDDEEKIKRFVEKIDGEQFGKFITAFKPEKGSFIYLKIGDCEIGPYYSPSSVYKEKLKSLLKCQERAPEVAQEIIIQLATIPIIARMIHGKILYPEIEEMENKIRSLTDNLDTLQKAYDKALGMTDLLEEKRRENEALKEKLKEKDSQLRLSLETWAYLANEISSSLSRANSCFYATMNEIGKE